MDDKQYNEYDLIIRGKVTGIIKKEFSKYISVKIFKYYKGKLKSKRITIETPANDGICGIAVTTGEEWLIFTYKRGDSYVTNLCTRTKTLSPKAWNYRKEEIEDDLIYLEEKLKKQR